MKDLSCFIVEDHNNVVPHLYRAIGSKKVAFNGLTMVHFDSHPDMLSPKTIKGSDVFDKHLLFSQLSIENWILPILYAGHVSTVIWVKCEWANQIPDGSYTFQVGSHIETGLLRVTIPESYFVSELLYCPPESLDPSTIRDVKLIVVTVSSSSSQPSLDLPSGSHPWILDVDLDFFSTQNPFTSMYSEEQLRQLQTLYYCPPVEPGREEEAAADRCQQLQELKALLLQCKDEAGGKTTACSTGARYDAVKRLVNSLLETSAELDIDQVHEVGCTYDCTPLPHHVSGADVIDSLVQRLGVWCASVGPPQLITIARSSDDDYCPKNQVDSIQTAVIKTIQDAYGTLRNIRVTRDY